MKVDSEVTSEVTQDKGTDVSMGGKTESRQISQDQSWADPVETNWGSDQLSPLSPAYITDV